MKQFRFKVRCGDADLISIGNKAVCGRCDHRVGVFHAEGCHDMPLAVNAVVRKTYGKSPTKYCSSCGRHLPLAAFARDRSTIGGLQTWCTHCFVVRARKRRERHKEET